jgi:large subunit ribosomal protein L2
MGGGEGKASGGHPRSRNGLYSKGFWKQKTTIKNTQLRYRNT